jgi:predicted XRE-type DNA-binding protein
MVKRRTKKKTEAQLRRAKFLKKLMIDRDFNAASIARSLGMVRSAVTHFVNGDTDSKEIAKAFATLSGLTVEEILQGRILPHKPR